MKRYAIVDYRCLVSDWFNSFLPNWGAASTSYIERAGIVYVNSVKIDSSLETESLNFFKKRLADIGGVGEAVLLVAREPKPVNNARLQTMLKFVEGNMDKERVEKVLHLANRRYVPVSKDVLISQEKELVDALDSVFDKLAKSGVPNAKTYQIQSLGIDDFVDAARAFFPKKSLSIQEVQGGRQIEVKSTNQMLESLNSLVVVGKSDESSASRFVERCQASMRGDMAELV